METDNITCLTASSCNSSTCICAKEHEITETHVIVKRLEKELLGNGHIGLVKEFQRLKGAALTIKCIVGVIGALSISSIIIALITAFVSP